MTKINTKRNIEKFTQFGCCRSGSTLVLRMLRYVFPETIIERRIPDAYRRIADLSSSDFLTSCNNLSRKLNETAFKPNEKIVYTVRNPIDVLASTIRINHPAYKNAEDMLINDQTLNYYIDRVSLHHHNFWRTVEEHDNECLFLKYESFWSDYDYIFDNLESFFNIKIQGQKRESIKNKVSIKETIKIQKKVLKSVDGARLKESLPQSNDVVIEEDGNYIGEDGDIYGNYFRYRDKESKIHGNHIMTPAPNNASKIFTEKQIAIVKDEYSEYIEKWKKL